MTPIKKFELTYGSFFGTYEQLVNDNGQLLYRSGHYIPANEQIIPITQATWEKFLSAVESVVQHWKRNYHGDVCDGLTWSVEIEALNLRSGGLHHFPEYYDTFLELVRTILGCPGFAEGHSQTNYLITGREPNVINKNVRHYLRRKHRTLQELADCLGYPLYWVRTQLNSTSTFELEDFHKIARFLDMRITDLLYEADLFPPRGRARTITPNHLMGLRNSVRDLKKDLPHLLTIDPRRMS